MAVGGISLDETGRLPYSARLTTSDGCFYNDTYEDRRALQCMGLNDRGKENTDQSALRSDRVLYAAFLSELARGHVSG